MRRMVQTTLLAVSLIVPATAALTEPAAMRLDGRTTMPIGQIDMCNTSPEECRQRGEVPLPERLNSRLKALLSKINHEVNHAYLKASDLEMWGKEEVWSYPVDRADTEDFALEKRRRLIAAGLKRGNVLITIARTATGYGVALVTVRTDKGDFVLDSANDKVQLWTASTYSFLKRQAEDDSGKWLSIIDDRAPE